VVLCAVAAFLMFFIATFPFENQSPERAAADDWLIGAAPVILILALAIVGAVIARRAALAAVALVAQFAVAAVVVAYALRESDHSDGRLVLYAMAVAVTAVAAVTATHVQQR
jgi:quinol-cytochrome oxidoreductase complex cytochrome b subunit